MFSVNVILPGEATSLTTFKLKYELDKKVSLKT